MGGGKGWRIERDGTTVRATFEGLLDEERGLESADALFEVVRELAVVDLVFDVHQMEGYETAARKAWQHVLVPLRTKIRSLRTIGANATSEWAPRRSVS